MPHDVFISYSSIDRAAADAACATLEAAGIRCWIAPRDITPGTEWAGAIYSAIADAKVMVLIFSANANSSAQVRREVELAVNEGLTIMPIRLEDHKPTESMAYFMAGVHWIDAMTPPLEAHLETVITHIRPYLPPPAPPAIAPIGAEESIRLMNEALHLAQAGEDEECIDALLPIIERIEATASPELEEAHTLALYNLGCRYHVLRRYEKAVERFREIVDRFGNSSAPVVREIVCQAMPYLTASLEHLGRYDEALETYEDMLRRFDHDSSTEITENVLMALSNRARLFETLLRKEDELRAYDDVIGRMGPDLSERMARLLADVMVRKGVFLARNWRSDEALATHRENVARFEASTDPALRQDVARSLLGIAYIFVSLGRFDEAIALCDRIIVPPGEARFMDSPIAEAMYAKAFALNKASRPAEAIAASNDLILRFAGNFDHEVGRRVVDAQFLKSRLTDTGPASR